MLGIFDSGIGGLTVVKEIKKELPGIPLLYVGDTARLPYGTKSKETVTAYSKEIANFLIAKKATMIVIACNTASSIAGDYLKKLLAPIPVFEVITPAVTKALESTRNGKIGVIGTPGTIQSGIYQKKMKNKDIYARACPLFVPLIEEGWIYRKETDLIARHYLDPIRESEVDTLILGCTHYPLLEETIRDILKEGTRIINPAKELAKELKTFVEKENIRFSPVPEDTFFVTDEPYKFESLSRLILGKTIHATRISLA